MSDLISIGTAILHGPTHGYMYTSFDKRRNPRTVGVSGLKVQCKTPPALKKKKHERHEGRKHLERGKKNKKRE